MQPQDPEPEVDLRCRCGLHVRVLLRHRTGLVDLLPRAMWERRTTAIGGRFHFCIVVDGDRTRLRSIAWKDADKLVGLRPYVGGHREREPNRWGDPDSSATRAFLRDVLRWPYVDAHDGWLIFKTPPSEVGVHPADSDQGEHWATTPHHQLTLMCDDLKATAADLRAKGVVVDETIEDQGFGLVVSVEVPGAGSMLLYEPRHALAYNVDG